LAFLPRSFKLVHELGIVAERDGGGLESLCGGDVALLEALALPGGQVGVGEGGARVGALVEAVDEHLRLELLGVDFSLGLHFY